MFTNQTTAEAENRRILKVVNDPRVRGLEAAAAALALDEPALSAERVIEIVSSIATASGFNRTAGLSAAVDKQVEGAR